MLTVTKQQLNNLFQDSSKSWEDMAAQWSTETNLKITPKMVIEMFKANGFNPKSRKRAKAAWFQVIEDSVPVSNDPSTDVSDFEPISTEEYA